MLEQRIKEYCQHDEDTYYIIFHDKDINDDGTLKPLHAHFYIDFKNGICYSQIKFQKFQGKRGNHQCIVDHI